MTRRYFIAHLPRFLVIVHDLSMVCLAWIGLRWLALEAGAPPADAIEREIFVAVVLQGIVLWLVGLYRGVWRFASLPDLYNLVRGAMFGVAAIVAVNLARGAGCPETEVSDDDRGLHARQLRDRVDHRQADRPTIRCRHRPARHFRMVER